MDAHAPATGGRQWCCWDSRTEDMVPKPRDSRIRRVQTMGYSTQRQTDGSTVRKKGEKTLIMSTADGPQLRKVTVQVANDKKALAAVSEMVRNGKQSGVRCIRGRTLRTRGRKTYYGFEKETECTSVDMMVALDKKRTEDSTVFLGGGPCTGACKSK